ncbi:MAG: hypothetical protein QOF90_2039 [Acetobacteraceae bacterium]|jgi:hypothetical protein|nr:hypothetical protein [Acetobacteraceae bacterium]
MNAPGTLALVRLSETSARNQTGQVSLHIGEVTFKQPAMDCKNVRGRITPTRSPQCRRNWANEIGPTNLVGSKS